MGQATQKIPGHSQGEGGSAAPLPAAAIEQLATLTARYNGERQVLTRQARRKWWRYGLPTALAACVVAFLMASWIETRFGPVGIVTAAGGVFSLCLLLFALPAFFIREPARLAEAAFRRNLMPALFPFAGDLQFYEGGLPSEMERFSRTQLFSYSHSEHRHTLTGDFEGRPFLITEIELVRGHVKVGGTKRQVGAFAGILVRLPPPDGFGGTLLVRSLSLGGFHLPPDPVRGEARLFSSGDAGLDRRLIFFSDRTGTHAPLAKPIGQMVVSLMDASPRKQIHLAITGTDCFVLLTPSRGLVELPALNTPIDVDRHLLPAASYLRDLLMIAESLRTEAGSPQAAN